MCDNVQVFMENFVVVMVVSFPSCALSCPSVSEEEFGVVEIIVDCAFQKIRNF
jgi:hypothetical protein